MVTTKVPAGQEFLADIHRLLEQAARVPAQVQHQRLHALGLELLERGFQVGAGLLAELHQADVADLVVAQREFLLAVDVLDHVNLDDGAGELVVLDPAGGGAKDGDVHLGAGLAAQVLDGILQAHLLGALAVNLDDAVAGQDAGLEAGAVFHGGDDGDEIVLHGNHDAEAAERALGVVLQLLVFLRLHELAVRVQRVEHAFEGGIDQFLVSQLLAVHIVLADLLHHVGKELEAGVGGSFSAAWAELK